MAHISIFVPEKAHIYMARAETLNRVSPRGAVFEIRPHMHACRDQYGTINVNDRDKLTNWMLLGVNDNYKTINIDHKTRRTTLDPARFLTVRLLAHEQNDLSWQW